jgi:hypothetical protein
VRGSAPIMTKTAAAGDLFTLADPDVLKRQRFQAGLAVAAGNSGAEPDSDVRGRLQLRDEAAGHAAGRRLAPYEQRDPGDESGQVQAA